MDTANCSQTTCSSTTLFDELNELPSYYLVPEILISILACIGNALVIADFCMQDKKQQKISNYYIVSLAFADILVSIFGVPFAVLARMGLPRDYFRVCLFMLSCLLSLCTVSIFNLVAIAADCYEIILYPFQDPFKKSRSKAIKRIFSCWIFGLLIGMLPLIGFNNGPVIDSKRCLFIPIIPYYFLVCLYITTIILPLVYKGFVYYRISLVVASKVSCFKKALPDVRTVSAQVSLFGNKTVVKVGRSNFETTSRCAETSTSGRSSGQMSNSNTDVLVRGQSVRPICTKESERKKSNAHKLFVIAAVFLICWVPLYTLNAVEAKFQWGAPSALLDLFIILSHLNSALNPLLYAFYLRGLGKAVRRFVCECLGREEKVHDGRGLEMVTVKRVNVQQRSAAAMNGGGGERGIKRHRLLKRV